MPAVAAGVSGGVAAGVAFGVAELLAGVAPDVPSLLYTVGERVIDLAPPPVRDAAISTLGTADKPALVIGTVVLGVLAGAGLGVLGRRRWAAAVAGFVAFGVLGVVAAAADPLADVGGAVLGAGVAVAAGVAVLRWLLALAGRVAPAGPDDHLARHPSVAARRHFVRAALAIGGGALLGGVVGRLAGERRAVAAARDEVELPAPVATAGPAPQQAAFDIDGLSPLHTPNADFYRIDTALMPPQVDVTTWRLRVTGMVDTPLELTFDDLQQLEQVEADVTIACVSNEVGGDLVGNARWQGVRLADVLERAGVQAGATQVVGRAVDGWTAGFPTEVALDGRNALIAVAMNGEPLPVVHGFPARLIVPGLYGYVSATKWLEEIELTTWEAFDAYWVPRGWSKEGPVKTASRIDVPARGASLPAGPVAVAGVAWAPHVGIERVEVRIDEGDWLEAELSEPLSIDTWVQWRLTWDATPGRHVITVRATDATGQTQGEALVRPAPNGAEGWHARSVEIV